MGPPFTSSSGRCAKRRDGHGIVPETEIGSPTVRDRGGMTGDASPSHGTADQADGL
jgi:hypothetical protein